MEKTNDNNSLGARIRQLRKERGLSQEALAQALDLSRQAVTKWEDGTSLPSTANLFALSALFGVPLAELTGTPENSAVPAAPTDAARNARVRTATRCAWCFLIPCALVLLFTLLSALTASPPTPEGDTIIGYADSATDIFVTGAPFPTWVWLASLGGFVAALGVLLGIRLRSRKK